MFHIRGILVLNISHINTASALTLNQSLLIDQNQMNEQCLQADHDLSFTLGHHSEPGILLRCFEGISEIEVIYCILFSVVAIKNACRTDNPAMIYRKSWMLDAFKCLHFKKNMMIAFFSTIQNHHWYEDLLFEMLFDPSFPRDMSHLLWKGHEIPPTLKWGFPDFKKQACTNKT